MKRLYIDNSLVFYNQGGYRKYIKKMKEVIKEVGGKNPRTSNKFGWSNQPSVLCFSATESQAKKIKRKLANELGFPVIINEKDW